MTHSRSVQRPARPRDGVTLVEVIVAITILTGATLVMGGFMAQFARTVGQTQARASASQLVTERLEFARAAGAYSDIDTLVRTEGPPVLTRRTASVVDTFPAYSRQTWVTRVGGGSTDTLDYRVVTVEVRAPGLATPVRKTTIVSAYDRQ